MRILPSARATLILAVLTFGLSVSSVLVDTPGLAEEQPAPGQTSPDRWLKTPTISIMTGFIYEPLEPYTIEEWMKNLGNRFNADQWVKDFKECGATHLVFYDKWIDGLVFHDTQTTNFKTKRDFVRELAAACQRQGLPLVLYFNALSDGNPEFDEWATLDRKGKPIVFGARWPTRYQTLHSPFRQKAVEQVRELLTDYGPIHGIWHDIFRERLDTSSPWVAKGYQEMFGEPFAEASATRLAEFNARTLADYLREVSALRTATCQDTCLFTANGSGSSFLAGGVWTDLVGSRLQYLFNEGHGFSRNDQLAQMAEVLPKPLDVNFKLNSSWFTPLEDTPPPSHLTEKQAIAGTAIAVCQGAGVSWALTPGHSGTFGEDLQRAKAVGRWFRRVRPCLDGARPYADVGVVLGVTEAGGPGLPQANPFWTRYQGRRQSAWESALGISKALARQGIFSRILHTSPEGGNWPDSLDLFRAVVVPETAPLDEAHLDRLRRYVAGGGRLLAFGHATLSDQKHQQRKNYGLADVLGARFAGQAAFVAEDKTALIRVDSEYNGAFGVQVLAGAAGEAWASSGTPMPHWIELDLPKPVDVARLELVNRSGPYQVTDLAIEVPDADRWKTIQTVQDSSDRRIGVTFAPPVRIEKLRISILRELFQGQDRQYADVAAVHLIDTKGHDWVGGAPTRIPLRFADPEAGRVFGASPLAWGPTAVDVKPTTARLVADLQAMEPALAILNNRFQAGEALLITTTDAAFAADDPFWAGLARLVAGEPTLIVKADDAQRYRTIVTCVGDAHVVHVIDSQTDLPERPPREVSLSLRSARLGNFKSATLAGGDEPLKLSAEGGMISLTVRPDPVASIILK